MKTWRLRKGGDYRVRKGHPWVFASELAHSAREVVPGEVVELRDGTDRFIARGMAHPKSQIAFRKLSANARETNVTGVEFIRRRLLAARELRAASGWTKHSHRWVFAEADGLPGLVIDLFILGDRPLAVVQTSTAGMEAIRGTIYAAIESLLPEAAIIEAPTSASRRVEGLELGEKRFVRGRPEEFAARPLRLARGLELRADMLGGQKTGFFLDQQANALALRRFLRRLPNGPVRILDICCYVGQWGAHAAAELGAREVHVQFVDSSRAALDLAVENARAQGATAEAFEADALTGLESLTGEAYDIVICDPPAFVKKKADLEAGLRAYVKLNREAMRLTKAGGLFVASSCSGLVRAAEFSSALNESSAKAGRLFQVLASTAHAPDHPVRADFPEGEYLKTRIGQIHYPF